MLPPRFFLGSISYVVFGYLRPDLETKVAFAVPSFESGRELRLPSLLSHERQRACGSLGSKSGQSLLTATALPPSSNSCFPNFCNEIFVDDLVLGRVAR